MFTNRVVAPGCGPQTASLADWEGSIVYFSMFSGQVICIALRPDRMVGCAPRRTDANGPSRITNKQELANEKRVE